MDLVREALDMHGTSVLHSFMASKTLLATWFLIAAFTASMFGCTPTWLYENFSLKVRMVVGVFVSDILTGGRELFGVASCQATLLYRL